MIRTLTGINGSTHTGVWTIKFHSDSKNYMYLYIEDVGENQRMGRVIKSDVQVSKDLPREEIIAKLAEAHVRLFPDYRYEQKLKEWETGRKILEQYGGDLEAYDRDKPQDPNLLKRYTEWFQKHLK